MRVMTEKISSKELNSEITAIRYRINVTFCRTNSPQIRREPNNVQPFRKEWKKRKPMGGEEWRSSGIKKGCGQIN